jgi:hypothetical protein
MRQSQENNGELIFSTFVTDTDSSIEEFMVELFDYSPDMSCSGEPKKVIKNFDELIDFFETLEV